MRSGPRSIARLTILSAALLLAFSSAPKAANVVSPTPGMAPFNAQGSILYRPEVRLRKLHLVRPDLIPYPIAYEVYC